MTQYEFIFSDNRWHRISRHVAFWFLWCLSFNLLFHFPVHVFRGWDISGPGTKSLQLLGPVRFFIKTFFVNSLFGVIIPQIVLTYLLVYWLFPNYFYKKRNWFITSAMTVFVVTVFYFIAVAFKHSSAIYNNITQGTNLWPYLDLTTQRVVIVDQLSSLPIILGFALMIKLVKQWWQKQKEMEQLAGEKTKAELQLLKAQVHPHFLFNTINNIYYFTLTNSGEAPVMIEKLSALLIYIINECDQSLVPLKKEIKMIQDYMALEKIRYADHMQMTIDIEDDPEGKMIAPLLLVPFVENSFKHGASKMITQPWIRLSIRIESNRLYFIIKNNKPAVTDIPPLKGNIGLKNVKKRLELLYAGTHELNIKSELDSYAVYLTLQLHDLKDLYNNKRITA